MERRAAEQRAEADWPHWPGRPTEPTRRERLERRLFSATDDPVAPERVPVPVPDPPPEAAYLFFVGTPRGYALLDGEGELPDVHGTVRLAGRDFVVSKLGRSPLPDDDRACAFLEPR